MDLDLEDIQRLFSILISFTSKMDDFLIENKMINPKKGTEKLTYQFFRAYKSFVYSVVKADDYVSFEEIMAIKELFQDDDSFSEIRDNIEFYENNDELNDPSLFVEFLSKTYTLQSCLNQENDGDNDIIPVFFDLFQKTGIYFAAIDEDIEESEIEIISTYLSKSRFMFDQILSIDVKQEVENKKKNSVSKKSQESTKINNDSKTTEYLIEELNGLIGLNQVKTDINNLVNLVKIMKIREERGLSVPKKSLHLVFTGNPGTGKTTVARLISEIYHSLGLLSKGHLVETDRSGLVAGYVGQTALKVQEIVNKALGGILFIDEAYSLFSGKGSQDYGEEAINTLLKLMEDNRDDLIVIAAGYPDKMNEFIESNPGLKSRFNKYIFFPDYGPDELFSIFKKMSLDHQLHFSDQVEYVAKQGFTKIFEKRTPHFGNGRDVRNIFEHTLSNQANRLVEVDNLSDSELNEIKIDDLKFGFKNYLENLERNTI
jgi:stage V sporulation protein K